MQCANSICEFEISRLARFILSGNILEQIAFLILIGSVNPEKEKLIRREMSAQLEQRAKGAARCK
jgi:hypothetical protein